MYRKGISLTEICVVCLLASVALVPIFGMIQDNARHVSFNQDRALAQILASQVIERYRCDSYEDMPAHFSSFDQGAQTIQNDPLLTELMFGMPEAVENQYMKYRREACFAELIAGVMGSFHVRVRWKNNQGQERIYETKTIFRNPRYRHGKDIQ